MKAKSKKYIFVSVLAALLAAAVFQKWVLLVFLFSGLLLWLFFENKNRTRFRFLAGNASGAIFKEHILSIGERIDRIVFSSDGEGAAALSSSGSVCVFDKKGRELTRLDLKKPPQAVLPGRGLGCLYLAWDKTLEKWDLKGNRLAEISFEPPDFVQGYTLKQGSQDGKVFLHTPWFVAAFDGELSSALGRLESSQVGNYMKYFALAPDGNAFFTGGALLLEEEAGIQARWSVWDWKNPHFEKRWLKEDEGPANSHLRGLAWAAQSGDLLAERYRDGYDILIYKSSGEEKWFRGGGEYPRLSPNGKWLVWVNPFDGLSLTQVEKKEKRWVRETKEKIRLIQADDEGRVLSLEGRHLILADSEGGILGDDWFYTDPFLIEASPDLSWWVAVRQGHLALLSWDGGA